MTNDSGCGPGYSSYDEHPGYDYKADYGTPVYAAAAGKVVKNRCYLGNMGHDCNFWGAVGIDHGNGYITQYLHMDPASISVKAGDQLAGGQEIGAVSDSGLGCNPHCYHLHFEVRAITHAIGPEKYPIVDPYGWSGKGSDSLYSAIFIPPQKLWLDLNVLYSFKGGGDGAYPLGGVTIDGQGNLYGTTSQGGVSTYYGTVFKVAPNGTKTVLHYFQGGSDGATPQGGVIIDSQGNLYGTTSEDGRGGGGTVFKLAPSGTETVLHSFSGHDGDSPRATMIMDGQGNLYGTTEYGGRYGYGTVFKLGSDGTETVLHSFRGRSDGQYPDAGVIMDAQGNLYGTTWAGCGTVFKLAPGATETVLHSFGGTDGCAPYGVIMDGQNNLYGATEGSIGYSGIYGTVFELAPDGTETLRHLFTDADGGYLASGITMDGVGNLYGTTGGEAGPNNNGKVFKLSLDGAVTVLHSFAGSDGRYPSGGLIIDGHGNLYGTTTQGGAYGYGEVFKLAP